MDITFELDSPRDLLAKARREQVRLREAIVTQNRTQIADAIFNFAVTAYHVKDWLKKSASGSYRPKDVEKHLFSVPVLRICREICNASKHRGLDEPAKDTQAVTASANAVTSPMHLQIGEVSLESEQAPSFRIKIVTFEGARFEVMDFSTQVIIAWEQFFTSHGLSM